MKAGLSSLRLLIILVGVRGLVTLGKQHLGLLCDIVETRLGHWEPLSRVEVVRLITHFLI